MQIAPFEVEEFFAQYEFNVPYLLAASDCESMSTGELVAVAGHDLKSLGDVYLGYTESQGDPELRRAIAARYTVAEADDVIVLSAPEEGILVAMQTLLRPGDDVVVMRPAYDSLRNLPVHICGEDHVRWWNVLPVADGWELSIHELETLLTPQTRLLVVNFPHNPTGFLPDQDFMDALIALAAERNLWLFYDEMYRGLELDGRETLPSAVDSYERAIVLAGLSKVHGLPGLRSGWLATRDAELREQLINWKHYTSICAPAPSERLARIALEAEQKLVQRNRAIIATNVEIAEAFFARWQQLFTWRRPQAGSVALVEWRRGSARAHCEELIAEAGVLLLPGAFLGTADRFFRLGLGRRNFAQNLLVYENYLQTHKF